MRIQTAVKLVGLVILGLILWRIDFTELPHLLRECRLRYVLFALLLLFVSAFFKSLRWQLMLKEQGLPYTVLRSFKRYLAGIFIGIITPGRIGELSRALYVKRDLNASIGLVFSSVVVDRIYDLYLLLIFGLAAGFFFHLAGTWSSLFLVLIGMLFVGPMILLHPVIGHRLFVKFLHRFTKEKIKEVGLSGADDFFQGMSRLVSPKIIVFALLTIVAYVFYFYGGYLLTVSIGMEIPFVDAALALALANMMSLLPITVAGVGTRDAVFVLVLGTVGVSPAAALAFSMLVLATSYLGIGSAGFFFFVGDKPPKPDFSD